jgi:carboxyl-terminal processing protease
MRAFIPLLFALIFLTNSAYSQQKVDETANQMAMLRDVFVKVKENSVFRPVVDWPNLEREIFENTSDVITETDFKDKVRLIFTKIGDKHGAFFYKGERLGMDLSWTKNLRVPANQPEAVRLSTKLLADGYGYILLPSENGSSSQISQRYQDSLCGLGLEHLKGLIIDLRLHQGGSVFPLFAGLNQLFGAKYFGASVNFEGKAFYQWTVSNGEYGRNRVTNRCKESNRLKIVVLTSPITASAGEMMAVGLKGRPRTLFLGEPTAGLTTMNAVFSIGKHTLAVATNFIADRKGIIYKGTVLPDAYLTVGDNFNDLSKDLKVIAAMKWLKDE